MFVTANPDVFYIATGYSARSSTRRTTWPRGRRRSRRARRTAFTLGGSMAGDPGNPDRMWACRRRAVRGELDRAVHVQDALPELPLVRRRRTRRAIRSRTSAPVDDVDFAGGDGPRGRERRAASMQLGRRRARRSTENGADGALGDAGLARGRRSRRRDAGRRRRRRRRARRTDGRGANVASRSRAGSRSRADTPGTPPAPRREGQRAAPGLVHRQGQQRRAKIVGKRVRVRVRGTIKPPAGARRAPPAPAR